MFARGVAELCIVRGVRDAGALRFPEGGVLWRGGALPEAHQEFYAPGMKYRVPGFLATSASRQVTYDFIYKVLPPHTHTHPPLLQTRTCARTHIQRV